MHAEIKVADKTASVHVYSGLGHGPHIKLVGSTFPVVPTGTVVDKLSVKVPDGLHGIALFCRVNEPQRMGSGKTAYLDHTPRLSSMLLLSWVEDDKVIMKADKDMTPTELAKLNSFVRSDADVLVVDADHKIAYGSNARPQNAADPTWTYKSVSMDAMLEYITKKLTMEKLDARATSEQRTRDELSALRSAVNRMSGEIGCALKDNESLGKVYIEALTARAELIRMLQKSRGLYKLLKRLPGRIRPKAFDGFVEAMDSLNQSRTA